MKTITVTVSPAGELDVRATGYAGPACRDATAFLASLGTKANDDETAEFFAVAPTDAATHAAS